MSQNAIKNNFVYYLTMASERYVSELSAELETMHESEERAQTIRRLREEHETYVGQLQFDLDCAKGFCFGLSLCHGAMELAGKLNWWQHVLVALCRWDGESVAALDEKVPLPDVEPGREKTLGELFELVINFVVYHQASHADYHPYKDFIPSGMHQETILLPSERLPEPERQNYLEMLDTQGNIQTVQQYYPMVGYFTEQELKSMLTPALLQDAICLIGGADDSSGERHVIRISYNQRGNLKIYDANFEHSSIDEMYLEYSVDEGIAYLLERLGGTRSLVIRLVALTPRGKFLSEEYQKRIERLDVSLMQKKGLLLLIFYIPGIFERVLEKASKADLDVSEKDAICGAIANVLKQKNGKESALHLLIQTRPECISLVMHLALHASDPYVLAKNFTNVIKALLIKNKMGQTGWSVINKYFYQESKAIKRLLNGSLLSFPQENLEFVHAKLVDMIAARTAIGTSFFASSPQPFLSQLQAQARRIYDIRASEDETAMLVPVVSS